ncbi:MAG TPA: TSUP family transporter [Mycobacteriales bacterium]|nr:TSUP family transporter [Mycobacteriales bacterium]
MLTLLLALSVAAGALAQAVSGIGFVLVCGPALVAILGAADGVRLGVLLSLGVNIVVLLRARQHVVLRDTVLLLLPAAIATPLLVRVVRDSPPRLAEALAGATALLGALALAAGLRWRAAAGRVGAVGAGVVSAAMNVLGAIGGPAAALYAANAGWPASSLRSTLQAYFLGLNLVALASLGLPDVEPQVIGACAAGVALGLVAGVPLGARVSETLARRTTLTLAGLGGLLVLVGALR